MNGKAVAWYTKAAYPTSKVYYRWSADYSFVWGEIDKSENVFEAAQEWDADVSSKSQVTLTKPSDAYTFGNLTKGDKEGVLEIIQDNTVSSQDRIYSGIAVSGSPIFIANAQPNVMLSISVQANPVY